MRVLMLNQAWPPDVVSSGQHAADLARELVRRGHEVRVICSRTPYNGGREFAAREVRDGVTVTRVRGTALGKGSLLRRAADFASFLAVCALRALREPRADVVVALTSPPLIASLGAALVGWRGGRLVSWVLDLNPDEAIAAGALPRTSPAARVLERLLRYSLRRSAAVAVMDRFMAARVASRGISGAIHVAPPWSLEGVDRDAAGASRFRAEFGLGARYVVMYAGNHSPCHPLSTLLEAARLLREEAGIVFCFCGGGSEFDGVKRYAQKHQLSNVRCVPYQPLEKLAGMLSAADLHAVVMGNEFVGIVHPGKVYNILTLGTPLLYVGPEGSHIAELGAERPAGYFAGVRHGEAEKLAEEIRGFAARGAMAPAPWTEPQPGSLRRMAGLVESLA